MNEQVMNSPNVDVLAVMDDTAVMARMDNDWNSFDEADFQKARAAVAELIVDSKTLVEALNALITMDVRGHQLQDRLQFSDTGRAILAKIDAARPAMARIGGDV